MPHEMPSTNHKPSISNVFFILRISRPIRETTFCFPKNKKTLPRATRGQAIRNSTLGSNYYRITAFLLLIKPDIL